MQYLLSITCAVVLLISSIQDIRSKTIDILLPVILIAFISFSKIVCLEKSILDIVLSVFPGMVMLLISLSKKRMIGFADGIIMCFLGVCEDLYMLIMIGLFGFVIAWVVIIYEYLINHTKIKDIVIPFVPCLACAWLIMRMKEWLL